MDYIVGDATTKNSLLSLYRAIAKHKVIPYMLNSDRGTQFIPNKYNKKGKATHKFQESLEELGITFIPSKRRHPQTNGKKEKFFHILDSEFDERFNTLNEFIKWYNEERLSEAVNYMTPLEAYKKRISKPFKMLTNFDTIGFYEENINKESKGVNIFTNFIKCI
jgi:transposase InsO family protein